MKTLLKIIAVSAFAVAAMPALSQTNQNKPNTQSPAEQNAPGTGGVSKPGIPGTPGTQSGPTPSVTVGEGAAAKTPGGLENPATSSTQTHQQDQSGVAGLPGNKAGPAVKAPSK
jgi:hypothetical protein